MQGHPFTTTATTTNQHHHLGTHADPTIQASKHSSTRQCIRPAPATASNHGPWRRETRHEPSHRLSRCRSGLPNDTSERSQQQKPQRQPTRNTETCSYAGWLSPGISSSSIAQRRPRSPVNPIRGQKGFCGKAHAVWILHGRRGIAAG